MSRPGIEPVTSRSPERTLYQLSYRVGLYKYIGRGVSNSHLGSNPDLCYIRNRVITNRVITNRVIKRFRCTKIACSRRSYCNIKKTLQKNQYCNDKIKCSVVRILKETTHHEGSCKRQHPTETDSKSRLHKISLYYGR